MRKLLIFYGAVIIAHYIAPHVYVYSCTPNTITGFLMSPFIVTTPYCNAFRWIIYHGGNYITIMWISLGIWVLDKIKIYE
jgi:hypothetical protein